MSTRALEPGKRGPQGAVEAAADAEPTEHRLVLRANQSLGLRGAGWLLFGLLVVYAAIGIPLAIAGLWLVLPFAGLEWLALAACLYLALERGSTCEVVTVRGGTVTVESGRRHLERRSEFQRAWVQVRLQEPTHHWYPSRLVIGSHGKLIEVGSFLSEEARRACARELVRIVHDRDETGLPTAAPPDERGNTTP